MIAGGASEKPLESMATTYLYGKPCICVSDRKRFDNDDGETNEVHAEMLCDDFTFHCFDLASSS